jgi:UDP:flavonoid glycosyltransferase YjiC (YdhE family)
VPDAVRDFFERARASASRVIFVSYGSFGNVPELRKVTRKLVRQVAAQRHAGGWAVFFHDTADDDALVREAREWAAKEFSGVLFTYAGFVPYDVIVPRVDMVVFTGSMCLQHACLRARTPMLFVPLLTEQFFWAKNYQHFTGVPYVSVEEEDAETQIKRSLRALWTDRKTHVATYLERVSRSMSAWHGCARLSSVIAEACQAYAHRKRTSAFT